MWCSARSSSDPPTSTAPNTAAKGQKFCTCVVYMSRECWTRFFTVSLGGFSPQVSVTWRCMFAEIHWNSRLICGQSPSCLESSNPPSWLCTIISRHTPRMNGSNPKQGMHTETCQTTSWYRWSCWRLVAGFALDARTLQIIQSVLLPWFGMVANLCGTFFSKVLRMLQVLTSTTRYYEYCKWRGQQKDSVFQVSQIKILIYSNVCLFPIGKQFFGIVWGK